MSAVEGGARQLHRSHSAETPHHASIFARRTRLQGLAARGYIPRGLQRYLGIGYRYEEIFPRYLHVLKPPDMGQAALAGENAEICELKRRFKR